MGQCKHVNTLDTLKVILIVLVSFKVFIFNENILPATMKTENPCDLVRIKNRRIFHNILGHQIKVSRRMKEKFYCSIFQCNFVFHDLESKRFKDFLCN